MLYMSCYFVCIKRLLQFVWDWMPWMWVPCRGWRQVPGGPWLRLAWHLLCLCCKWILHSKFIVLSIWGLNSACRHKLHTERARARAETWVSSYLCMVTIVTNKHLRSTEIVSNVQCVLFYHLVFQLCKNKTCIFASLND